MIKINTSSRSLVRIFSFRGIFFLFKKRKEPSITREGHFHDPRLWVSKFSVASDGVRPRGRDRRRPLEVEAEERARLLDHLGVALVALGVGRRRPCDRLWPRAAQGSSSAPQGTSSSA